MKRVTLLCRSARATRANPRSVEHEARILAGALAGDEKAIRALVNELTPIIQARAGRILFSRFNHSRDLHEAAADATQDVLSILFADGARTLRSWSADRGLSLANFVGLVAERHVLSSLRGGSRVAARERSATDEELTLRGGADRGPDSEVTRRMTFDAVIARVETELTPQGRRIFELAFIEDWSIEAISAEVGLSHDAVYAWRSRLLKSVRRVAAELDGDSWSENAASTRSSEKEMRDE
jgi:DNA-directed RNA polymerase specialized sigma24 family protein